MAAVESGHVMSSKTLLNGTVLPAGQTAEQDMAGALGNLFNHQNVGPFVCKQLIQHLVTSTPSPAYVSRVAAVFANNGTGVRGNMQAVIKAILLDQEARAGDTNSSFDGGHLREPVLFMTAMIRGLAFTNTDVNGSYFSLSNQTSKLNRGALPRQLRLQFLFAGVCDSRLRPLMRRNLASKIRPAQYSSSHWLTRSLTTRLPASRWTFRPPARLARWRANPSHVGRLPQYALHAFADAFKHANPP